MKNIFTDYLINNGWLEVAPMSYKNGKDDLEIFFDTSNQIEIYNSTGRIKDAYLQNLEDLIAALRTIRTSL